MMDTKTNDQPNLSTNFPSDAEPPEGYILLHSKTGENYLLKAEKSRTIKITFGPTPGEIAFGPESPIDIIGPAELWGAACMMMEQANMIWDQQIKMQLMKQQSLQTDIARAVTLPDLKRRQ